jgi:hypothetical protein
MACDAPSTQLNCTSGWSRLSASSTSMLPMWTAWSPDVCRCGGNGWRRTAQLACLLPAGPTCASSPDSPTQTARAPCPGRARLGPRRAGRARTCGAGARRPQGRALRRMRGGTRAAPRPGARVAVVVPSVSPGSKGGEAETGARELLNGGHLVNQRRNSTHNTRVAAQVRRRVSRQAENGHPWHKLPVLCWHTARPSEPLVPPKQPTLPRRKQNTRCSSATRHWRAATATAHCQRGKRAPPRRPLVALKHTMAIGDTSTPQSQARLADLGQRLASLEAAHLGPLIAALEAPPRVRDAPSPQGRPTRCATTA